MIELSGTCPFLGKLLVNFQPGCVPPAGERARTTENGCLSLNISWSVVRFSPRPLLLSEGPSHQANQQSDQIF